MSSLGLISCRERDVPINALGALPEVVPDKLRGDLLGAPPLPIERLQLPAVGPVAGAQLANAHARAEQVAYEPQRVPHGLGGSGLPVEVRVKADAAHLQ